ncbi:uncharacterized protein LOC135834693 [Planococcus citri]|uniref:uncharacterized protein LOC135834693 n=1 Tax=Planococcus citri TaxID=170843 RepID=UPI0031F788C8
MLIILLLLIFVLTIKTEKLFSYKTVSIAFLSFPVLSFIDGFISKFIETEGSFEVKTTDLIALFLVCTCICGLIGIEKKKEFLLSPVLLVILILIVGALTTCIHHIVEDFDFKNAQFKSRDVSVQFQYAVIVEFLLIYAGHVILVHYWDLLDEYQPPKSTQTSKSNPSSEALIINVSETISV